MAIHHFDLMGSPNIGVYALTTNDITILPLQLPRPKLTRLRNILHSEVVSTTLGGTTLIGVLAAANSNGIVLPYYVYDEEIRALREIWKGNIARIEGRHTAFGNLILANDHGAIVSKSLLHERACIRQIQDVLDVETVPGEIAGLSYVGSLATSTNKGVLTHPFLRDDERRLVTDTLKVPVDVGTINGGVPFVSSGILANEYGVVIGPPTTGPEIVIITNLFDG